MITLFPLVQARGRVKWRGEDEELGEGVRTTRENNECEGQEEGGDEVGEK